MFAKAFALLAVSALSLSVQAAPAVSRTGSGTAGAPQSATGITSATAAPVTLPIPTQLGFPTGTVTLSDAVKWVNVHSDDIASYIGSSALRDVQATLGVMDAQKAIGSATHLTALIATDVNSAPVVVISSIGGSAITLATGTVGGGTTTFGGQAFHTAAPAVLAADSSSATSNSSSASGSGSASSSASSSTSTGKGNGAAAGVSVPRSAVVGALAVLGSVAMGAVAVL